MTAVFAIGQCFRNLGADDNTIGWCIGEILILAMATICLIGSSLLFKWQFDSYASDAKQFLTRHATWIFILMVLYSVMVFLKYLLDLNSLLDNYGLWIISMEFLQSMILYTTCSMFA